MKHLKIGLSVLLLLLVVMSQAIAQTDEKEKVKVKTKKKVVVIKKEKDDKGNIIVEEIITEGDEADEIIKELKIEGNTIERIENKKTKIIKIEDGKISGLPKNLEDGDVEVLEFESWDDLPDDIKNKLEDLDIEIDGTDNDIIKLRGGNHAFFSDDNNVKINIKGGNFWHDDNGFDFHFNEHGGDVEVFEWDGDGEIPAEIKDDLKERGINLDDFDGKSGFRIELKEKPSKVVLGVIIGSTENESGVVIDELIEGGAAATANLKEGDIITAIDGKKVTTVKELTTLLKDYEPETEVKIAYTRDGKANETTAKLQKRNTNVWKDKSSNSFFVIEDDDVELAKVGNSAFLGVNYDSDYDDEENGLKIHGVVKKSPAEKAGLKKGDIITKIEDKTITDFNDLVRTLEAYEPDDKIKVTYKRDGKEKQKEIVLGKSKTTNVFIEKKLDKGEEEKEIIIIREKNDK